MRRGCRRVACFQEALKINPTRDGAWNGSGAVGGGKVAGIAYSKVACFQEALQINPTGANAWQNLGITGGGKVAGEAHSKAAC